MSPSAPEQRSIAAPKTEAAPSVVSQPVKIDQKMDQMNALLAEINDTITESTQSRPGEQWNGGKAGAGATAQDDARTPSPRDIAIANLPPPAAMQKQLEKHIRDEVKKLRKEAKRVARISQPGGAERLNNLYARMRQLNALLAHILHASVDAVKRLFIRVFIDKQTLI